jgi:hypothetical protein
MGGGEQINGQEYKKEKEMKKKNKSEDKKTELRFSAQP